MKESNEVLKYMICSLIEDLKDNNEDIESEMKKIGYIFGRKALEFDEFQRDIEIQSLLYKITYTFLEKIHSSTRRLEISTTNKNEYFIYEYEPFFTRHVSLPEQWKDFCPESIITGVIEYTILASGFECEVNGYVRPSDKYPNTVVYHIKLNKNIH